MSDYFIYRDEVGDFGYASMSFYEGAKRLLDNILIIKDDMCESRAKREAKELSNK
jgi:hypothetical protein